MRLLRWIYHSLKLFFGINWIKTLYFNFRMFDFKSACKLPVYFYGPVRFQNLSGKIIIDAPLKTAMIGFGQPYEMNTVHRGTAEIVLAGKIIFKGHAQFGKDYFVFVGKNAVAEFGHMAAMAADSKLVCVKGILLGSYARTGSENFITDTDFHQMADTATNEKFKLSEPVVIGNYNYLATRVTILKGTLLPDYCTVASNSLCNKDYTHLGSNILIGGIPAKLLRNNISRDWEGEKSLLDEWMKV
ncbi:MAG: acyltransferase [Flavobacterium sp.]